MPLDLRIRNILFPGRHIPKTVSHLSCGSVDIPYGESTFGAEATALAVKRQFPWDGKSPVRLTVSNRYFQESAEILPVRNIDGFYVWSSPSVHTMEVLICRSLKYGESIDAEFIVRRSPLTKCNAGYQAQTRNLALGARCIYSPQPNYKGCDGPGAETRLTDGVFARHPMIWLRKETVGWSLVANPEFVMDLGKVQKIKHIRYHLANGISNVRWPRAITVEGSRDNRSFTVLGDFLKTNQEQMLAYGVLVNTFLDLDVTGSWRYLRFRIPEGHIHFLDEIEVY